MAKRNLPVESVSVTAMRVPSGETANCKPLDVLIVLPGDSSTLTRSSGRSGAGRAARHQPTAARTPNAMANTAATIQRQGRRKGATSGTASSSGMASPMSRKRCFGCFTRQRRRRGCTFAGMRLQSGSSFSTAARMSDVVSPVNAGLPVNISYRTAPNAQMSARLSTADPRACSGLM